MSDRTLLKIAMGLPLAIYILTLVTLLVLDVK